MTSPAMQLELLFPLKRISAYVTRRLSYGSRVGKRTRRLWHLADVDVIWVSVRSRCRIRRDGLTTRARIFKIGYGRLDCWRRPKIEPSCRRWNEPAIHTETPTVARLLGLLDWLSVTSAEVSETAQF